MQHRRIDEGRTTGIVEAVLWNNLNSNTQQDLSK
tara:strand:- start:496 stop:597 length:102 start_codon:yes stop_codon:yes gene_type:complete